MIEFRNVSKVYDSNGTHALSNVNIKIEDGEFVFVVGSSGAGKSTFLKLIMHEEKPTEGEIIFNEYSSATLKKKQVPYYRREMGIVFQDFRLIPKMSVYDNVAFAMRVIGAKEKEIRKRVPYILQLVGLSQKARSMPNELSGGEQQRVSLARALVNNPKVIIADEPTGNVDPEMSHEIVGLLTKINNAGTTVIMVTHEHDLVRSFQRRVIVIKNGEVVSVAGNTCPRGAAYGRREVTNPTRIVTSTALVSGGVLPVVSVKTASDIPKGKIKDVMEAIRQIHAVAPVQIGDVLLHDAAGTGADIVATKNIPVATGFREN